MGNCSQFHYTDDFKYGYDFFPAQSPETVPTAHRVDEQHAQHAKQTFREYALD